VGSPMWARICAMSSGSVRKAMNVRGIERAGRPGHCVTECVTWAPDKVPTEGLLVGSEAGQPAFQADPGRLRGWFGLACNAGALNQLS
jgi:hypothetical protein